MFWIVENKNLNVLEKTVNNTPTPLFSKNILQHSFLLMRFSLYQTAAVLLILKSIPT